MKPSWKSEHSLGNEKVARSMANLDWGIDMSATAEYLSKNEIDPDSKQLYKNTVF
jgi:hypothetical protein